MQVSSLMLSQKTMISVY